MRIREAVAGEDGRLRRAHFDALTKLLHWSTVLLVLIQFATGMVLHEHRELLLLHRSSGATLWLVTVLRLCWRNSFAGFPAFPPDMPQLMRLAAHLSEYGLYLLLLAVPLTGLATTLSLGRPFGLFTWSVPALLPRDIALFQSLHEIHETGAWLLADLVGLHAVAALFHHVVRKDDVLRSMLP
jgi:cytochrome b561